MSWYRWVGADGAVLGLERFGASAPYERVYEELGLTGGFLFPHHVAIGARGAYVADTNAHRIAVADWVSGEVHSVEIVMTGS